MSLAYIINNLFNIIFWIIVLTILLSWIPNIDWDNPFFRFCKNFTDTILSPFRGIIPPIGGLDFSPIIALVVLQLVQQALVRILIHMNL